MYLSLDFALLGFASFAGCLALQILIWRFWQPGRHVIWLISLFFGLPYFASAIFAFLDPQSALLLLAPAILHGVLAANYIAIYPAFQASSPTVEILFRLNQSETGLKESELARYLGKALVQDRLEDLKQAGLVDETSIGLVPSRKGALLARFFMSYRKFIGLPEGAG